MITEESVERIRNRWERRSLPLVRSTLEAERDDVLDRGLLRGVSEYRWFDTIFAIWTNAGEDSARYTLEALDSEKALRDLVSNLGELRANVSRRARLAADRSRNVLASRLATAAGQALEAEVRALYQGPLGEIAAIRTVAAEVVSATAWAQQQVAIQAGSLLAKRWNTVGDDRVRPTHVEANGQLVAMASLYRVGGALLRYPGDPNGPIRETINCRCFETYERVEREPRRTGLGSVPTIEIPAGLLG